MIDEKKTLGCFFAVAFCLVVFTVIFFFCSCGETLIPVARRINIQCPDSLEIRVDGILQGIGPEAEILIIENYPNVLQVGSWTMVLFPNFTVDYLRLR